MSANSPLQSPSVYDPDRSTDPPLAPLAQVADLLGAVSDACLILDGAGRIVYANERAATLAQCPREHLLEQSAWAVLPASVVEPLRCAHERVTDRGGVVAESIRLESGSVFDARVTALGSLVAMVLIEDGAQDQAVVFDNIHDAVLIMDENTRIVDWNPAAEQIFGYSRAEALGRSPEFFHDPALEGRLEQEIVDVLRRDGRWSGQVPYRRKDGVDGVADVLIVEHRDASGALRGYIGVNRDATDRVRSEVAARASEDQLRHAQKMEAVGRLAGGVAHDFNNILTVITSYAEILRGEFAEGDPRRRDVDEVLKATTRAVGLTRQLLTVGRRQRIKPSLVDPAAVVTDLAAVLRQIAGQRVEIALQASSNEWLVRVDQAQFEQVIVNLASNAREAMHAGGVLGIHVARAIITDGDLERRALRAAHEGEESMSPERPGEYVVLSVSDTGAGMSRETRRRIFEPFFTTKAVGRGAGLGLATVYAVATHAGGHVRVRSAPGEGTTIEVYLPRALPDRASGERVSRAVSVVVEGGTETILIVEDEMSVRLSVRRILERVGYQVLEARHGTDALKLWRERRAEIALVLSDVIMPEMGGLELATALRREDPTVRILFMSGYTGTTEDGHPIATATPLLQKPFDGSELLQAVREQLD
jgi:two-component system, cell cycle sensor histidine kinase and response regulator CckA